MTHIDYMKVMDIAASTIEHGSTLDVRAVDIRVYAATIKLSDDSVININIRIGEYDLELTMNKNEFDSRKFKKWIKIFEYQLEQSFLKNIRLSYAENTDQYILNVSF